MWSINITLSSTLSSLLALIAPGGLVTLDRAANVAARFVSPGLNRWAELHLEVAALLKAQAWCARAVIQFLVTDACGRAPDFGRRAGGSCCEGSTKCLFEGFIDRSDGAQAVIQLVTDACGRALDFGRHAGASCCEGLQMTDEVPV